MPLKFPIGIQSFEKIRTEGYYYVDKTHFVKKLVDSGTYFFLSRPRRFGKSLFLDTLRQAFLARKDLFEGLYLENHWDWTKTYPVIYISFGAGVHKTKEELLETQNIILNEHAEEYKVSLKLRFVKDRFFELIKKLYQKYNSKVVVLVDEYDKPILDNIENTEVAIEMRESLKNFYSVLKDADPYLKFVFITGVSKFSKVSIFSGLNNLNDITIDKDYATICGYTQEEFETVFADVLKDIDLEEVRKWYNGYSWLAEPVYNPFDILLFLQKKDFRPYWFETGTPTFLIKLLLEKGFYLPSLENLEAGEEIVESFDIERINPITLLFQTGYLTIKERENTGLGYYIYHLRYPNLEVRSAFNRHFLEYLIEDPTVKTQNIVRIWKILKKNDVDGLIEVFKGLFAGIPYDWYRKSGIEEYEGFYGSVVYAYFSALGVDIRIEEATNRGRLDMAVIFNERCYIFEFKVVEGSSEGKALSQLKKKRYYEKYQDTCSEIYLIGVEFSKKERNIINFEWEKL